MSKRQRPHRPGELGPRLYQKRRGGPWFGDFRFLDGTRRLLRDPESAGWPDEGPTTNRRGEAEGWCRKYVGYLDDLLRRREYGLLPPFQNLAEAMKAFIEERARVVEPNTLKATVTSLRHLEGFLGSGVSTEAVRPQSVQAMVNRLLNKGMRPTTLQTYLAAISGFADWLGIKDLRRAVSLPDPGQPDVRTWELEELNQLRAAADALDEDRRSDSPSTRLALEAALATGARRNELFALAWRDFDQGTRTVRIHRQLVQDRKHFKPLKGKRGRTAVVLPTFWTFFEGHRPGLVLPGRAHGPFTDPQGMIDRLLEATDLKDRQVGWHSFRHTYSRLFLERGGRLEELQKSLGHSKIRTTEEIYGHLREDVAARLAVQRIYQNEPLRVVNGGL